MKQKIFFLLNDLSDFNFQEYLKKYLKNIEIFLGTTFPENPEKFSLIILWSYRRILKNLENQNNVILFHSTDLPKGKGWAPIYYSIFNNETFFTISGITASNKVDSGKIIVKAKFKILPNHTAEYIRKWDEEISIILIKTILKKIKNTKISGIPQKGKITFYKKRLPEDNELSSKNMINHLRACEKNHPAFFYNKNEKFFINIEPENIPKFPKDLKIKFYF